MSFFKMTQSKTGQSTSSEPSSGPPAEIETENCLETAHPKVQILGLKFGRDIAY
jgi:hypothetical protein